LRASARPVRLALVFGRLREEPTPQTPVGSTAPVPSGAGTGEEPRGPREGLILLAFTILTVAASAYVLINAEHDAVHDPAEKAARGEINGLDGQSLLREQNMRKVLAKVAAGKRPFIASIRVAAVRADLQVRDADGFRKLLSIDPGLSVKERDFGVGDDKAVQAEAINPAAPERMVRAVAERTGLGFDAVDYVTMTFAGSGERTWYMALDKGPARTRQWIAAPDGTDLRKPGELSQAQQDADARRKRRFEAEQRRYKRNLERRSACLSKARDATAAARCIQRFQP
jgi:hypothetical protein